MRLHFALVAVAVTAVWPALVPDAGVAAAPVTTGAVGGTWGTAEEVPGIAALDHSGSSDLRSVSGGSAGNCAAGGGYHIPSGPEQAFVGNQVNGTWHTALEVPGTAALNAGKVAGIYTVSCAAAGSCSAGGFYHDASGRAQGFVVSEKNGTWGTALKVPGLAVLNTGGNAGVSSVSCASAGNCSAGGAYKDGSGHQQVFVVGQANGTWGTAKEVPGTATLNQFGFARLLSLSCGAAGNCSAGGSYIDNLGHHQAFVASEKNGTWGAAEQVPGTAALSPGGGAVVGSVSCPAAGDCAAGGDAGTHPFVISETRGIWGTATVVPGKAVLNWRAAEVDAVSCGAVGNCSAGGHYADTSLHTQVFVASQVSGTWRTAQQVPGTAALNAGGNAFLYSLSCGAAGNCSTGGFYQDSATHLQAFVAGQVHGTWGTAQQVPGIAALSQGGNSLLWSVSCASAGNCSAGGNYDVNSAHQQAFVVSEAT